MDVVEVALVAIVVEVQRVAIAVGVHEETCGKSSLPPAIERSPACIEFGIKNPPVFRTKELCVCGNRDMRSRGNRGRRDSGTSYFRIRLPEAVAADAQSAYAYYPHHIVSEKESTSASNRGGRRGPRGPRCPEQGAQARKGRAPARTRNSQRSTHSSSESRRTKSR